MNQTFSISIFYLMLQTTNRTARLSYVRCTWQTEAVLCSCRVNMKFWSMASPFCM